MKTPLERSQGALLGLAVGDAVGTTLEFRNRGTFAPIEDMVGGGPFHLQPGQWTDDTSMALCLAASLLETGRFDQEDQMRRYVRWYRDGYMSSTGKCFDIGNVTASALRRFLSTGNAESGSTDPHSAGNGCLMRLAPVPIRYSKNHNLVAIASAASAVTTHGAPECVLASRVFGEMIARAIVGYSKEQILCAPEHTTAMTDKLSAVVIGRSYAKKPRNNIRGSGYVVESLEASLWAFYTTENYRDCVLAAANLGEDADTTAAIAGQLAGAFYGVDDIPATWRNKVYDGAVICKMAEDLCAAQEADSALKADDSPPTTCRDCGVPIKDGIAKCPRGGGRDCWVGQQPA